MSNVASPRQRISRILLDDGLAWILAFLAAAGSFTHIRDLAIRSGQHGWMTNATALCIDLMCVMAARERKRDQRLGYRRGRVTWPTVVLTMGTCLTIAANLATAQQSPWGWIMAATLAATFLIAVSMLERRANLPRPTATDIHHVNEGRTRGADVLEPQPGSVKATDPADTRKVPTVREAGRRSIDIELRARTVLARRPDITGADLGRELGVTERHGRRIRNRLASVDA